MSTPERTSPAGSTRGGGPKGIQVGGFRFYSGLEADKVFNENVYATSSALGTVFNQTSANVGYR